MTSPAFFKARFPEFVGVDDVLVQLVLDEAATDIGPDWDDGDRLRGQLLLTAHMLSLQGYPVAAGGDGGGGTNLGFTGAVKRFTVGDVTTEFAGSGITAGAGGSDGSVSGYMATVYGRMFLQLMRSNVGGVMAV